MNICTDYNFLQGVLIIKYIIAIALAVVPIIIIIMGSIDGVKAVMSGKVEDLKAIAFGVGRRVASVLIVLLLPTVLNILFSGLSNYNKVSNQIALCYENADKEIIAGYKKAASHASDTELYAAQTYLSGYNSQKYNIAFTTATGTNSSTNGNLGVSGKGEFHKYTLTDSQLKGLAAVAKREQGSLEGAAAEASLMANLFEKQGSRFGSDGEGLYNYVATSGWFAQSGSYMASTDPGQEYINVVKAVLVDGKRTLPAYVDEHDCWDCNNSKSCSGGFKGDICTLTTGGQTTSSLSTIKDRSQYKQHDTKVQNVFGSNYTFYTFPTSTSDPFGYISDDLRQQLGDDCYSFNQLGS